VASLEPGCESPFGFRIIGVVTGSNTLRRS
jgi:hypothetical protein